MTSAKWFLSLSFIVFMSSHVFGQENKPCTGGPYDLANRFVGTWKEYTVTQEGEKLVGTLHAAFDVQGCVFLQRFSSADGTFSFLSFGYVEPSTNFWYETFVFNNGRVASYRWREEGEQVIMDRVSGSTNEQKRLRIINMTVSAYDVVEEQSVDRGKTWKEVELTRTRRE